MAILLYECSLRFDPAALVSPNANGCPSTGIDGKTLSEVENLADFPVQP